ncbi:MAG: signal recognition particle-docking protein FtsY [Rhodospirillaceae bacterium]|nr:MAG: signal recognition particle-docking protein FtsY [Rhodospirillaceae bacterium]
MTTPDHQDTTNSPFPAPNLHQVEDMAGALSHGFDDQTRAFVLVSHGCDSLCTYCAVPKTQGTATSSSIATIIAKVQNLVQSGHAEVVLMGPNVAAYGADNGTSLAQLISELLQAVPDLLRLRLGTLDPSLLNQDFFDVLASEARLVAHLHLSLQSGDDVVLGLMKRAHTVAQINTLMAEARNARPGMTFGADIIAGFPGETDEMFAATVKAVKRWGFITIKAFTFRALPDTASAEFADQVLDAVVKNRLIQLENIASSAQDKHLNVLTGKVHAVLMETDSFGRTESFAPVRLAKPVGVGQIANVAVTALKDGELRGSAMGDYTTTSGDSAGGWLKKMRTGLGKSSEKMTSGIGQVFTVRRRLDHDALEELEEVLITADLGVSTAMKLIQGLSKTRFDKEVDGKEVREAFAAQIEEILAPVAKPLTINATLKPHVILVCGVNGSGKTTTIGKLTKRFTDEGKSVLLAAGDTFRAAAIEQLQVWGERTGAPVIARKIGSDSAGLAYDALGKARTECVDVLIIDTAGRLQNKTHLMEELEKVVRVMKKIDSDTPHDTLLVLDATIGQNAHSQVEAFHKSVDVTGLIMTKLDGTAKGGVVVALADKFGLPVHAIGVGEAVDDLQAFSAKDFARNLMGLG